MLACKNIIVKYGIYTALNNISLEFNRGEVHVLFGPNGAGKTTFLKVISTSMKPHKGAIVFKGKDVFTLLYEFRCVLGFLSHDLSLYNNLTAQENLQFWSELYEVKDWELRIEEVLQLVGLKDSTDKFVRQFSRGMKQRLAIARSMLHFPEVILWDEPYTGIDITTTQIINQIMNRMKNEGALIIFSTHDVSAGYALADTIHVLDRGKIVASRKKSSLSYDELQDILFGL
ncbi:MAG: heme ABC exporter, ATP-binding protein CcmA [Candidatus Fischerbacteria bacterium RBG_13_37_8]|uniref:Heme ABC exporter, ATP-binding protein CcmA n=1 Tax=Candidatus Fischerbacteria bacterium RBG_13_37_8 TaxID=1817863 RepID=A0A1F5VNJ4_9BACT|nr:MAG: heme ABC exporter, ATP-binding protein CcmA [Candidatus Fischerbacteria bacterium RBG_13_37_8]